MDAPFLNILKLSAQDLGGGAAEVARRLAGAYRQRGHRCMMAVGKKRGNDADVFELPDSGEGLWSRTLFGLRDSLSPLLGRVRGAGRVHDMLHVLGRPRRLHDRLLGLEDWTLPAATRLLELMPVKPDLVHAHNLHSFRGPYGHFDLTALTVLCRRLPVMLTLHDAWLTTGHCAHSIGCERWLSGCGDCPDLGLYPPLLRDATAENWRRKKNVFADSRLFVATPCQWLLDRVRRSILAPAMIEGRVIHNGVDLELFRPGDRNTARKALGLPEDARILLFAAQGVKGSRWKDFPTLRDSAARLAELLPGEDVLCLALGEDLPPEQAGRAQIRFVPYQTDPATVVLHYQAADLYLQASRAETFPNTILEAMACGKPVVASSVGGIPEQVSPKTGALVPPGDPGAMAGAAAALLADAEAPGMEARRVCERKFDLTRQADLYLSWFAEILEGRRP